MRLFSFAQIFLWDFRPSGLCRCSPGLSSKTKDGEYLRLFLFHRICMPGRFRYSAFRTAASFSPCALQAAVILS